MDGQVTIISLGRSSVVSQDTIMLGGRSLVAGNVIIMSEREELSGWKG